MGFSVYGRIGGQNENDVSNYGRNTYYPTVRPSRSYLSSGMSRPRVISTTSSGVQQPYNPKSQTFQKKENKNLKTALIVVGAATAAFVARKPIEGCLKAIRSGAGKVFGPTLQKVSKVTIGDACKAPVSAIKKVGGAIVKPFQAVGKVFAKKP